MIERQGIFISGGGTTMAKVIEACQIKIITGVETGCVIASDPNAGGIQKAIDLGVPKENIFVINPNDFRNPSAPKTNQVEFGEKIIETLKSRRVSFVTQNGWMPLTPKNVIDEFSGRIFNQHPAPVPEFGGKGMYGRRPHQAIIEFSRLTGRTDLWTEVIAQRSASSYDAGAVVGSARIYFDLNDTGDTLQQRALPFEHQLQIKMVQDFVNGNLIEIHRTETIVFPGQEDALQEAKRLAIAKYPNG